MTTTAAGAPRSDHREDAPTDAADRVRRGRRRAAGVLLVVAAAALAVAEVVHPRGGPDVFAESLAAAAGRWELWGSLVMLTALLQLPAVVVLRGAVVSGPGRRLVAWGGGVTAVSLVALVGFGLAHAQGARMAGAAPVDPAVLDAFARADGTLALGVTAVLAIVGFHVGWPLLLVGLARAHRAPWWWAGPGAAVVVGGFVGAALGPTGETVLFLLTALVLALLGARLVTTDPCTTPTRTQEDPS